MRKGTLLGWLCAAAGLVCAAAPAPAQTFAGSTEVVVVEIPVQVVRDGEPVRGLTANDFEVYDGRKRVPVTGFEVLDLALPLSEGAPAAAQVPVSARRHFLLLFDLSFSEPKAIVKARAAAQSVVKSLHPTDLVAVATYSSFQGPQLVIGFTPDREQIAAAVATLGVPTLVDRAKDPLRLVLTHAVGTTRGQQVRDFYRLSDEAKDAAEQAVLDGLEAYANTSERADRLVQQDLLRTMTKSLADLARLMAEVEGRKYVVYLSEGFDHSLVAGKAAGKDREQELREKTYDTEEVLGGDGKGKDVDYGDTRSQNAVEKMLEEFRRADCQIQAVDIGGLRADADQGFQRTSGRDSLFNMATSTGGELYENFNDLSQAMGQMLRRTAVTYVLAFQPQDLQADGSYHKLRVELKGNAARGARVVYRPGYYAPVPYRQAPALLKLFEAASQVMGHESGDLVSSVLAPPLTLGGDLAYVPVLIEVDGPALLAGRSLAPNLPVEIYVYALDGKGGVQDFLTQTVSLDLVKAEPVLRQSGLKFFGHLDLPAGTYSLRTLVRNGANGASSLRVTRVEVPTFAKGEPALLPALFPEPPGRWLMIREVREGQEQVPYPFMLKDQPFIPSSRPVLAPGRESQVALMGYNLGTGEWKAEARVLSVDGRELPGGEIRLVEKEAAAGPGPVRMLATFRPPDLGPGEYVLRVTLTDGAGTSRTSVASFVVGPRS
ncbi:MAG TPA: VWA domain-containing protein [Thermoanaerobaculia bacterium]|jgi:VWFA-related protein